MKKYADKDFFFQLRGRQKPYQTINNKKYAPGCEFILNDMNVKAQTLQTHHMYSTVKRCGNNHFHVVSTWNGRSVFLGFVSGYLNVLSVTHVTKWYKLDLLLRKTLLSKTYLLGLIDKLITKDMERSNQWKPLFVKLSLIKITNISKFSDSSDDHNGPFCGLFGGFLKKRLSKPFCDSVNTIILLGLTEWIEKNYIHQKWILLICAQHEY